MAANDATPTHAATAPPLPTRPGPPAKPSRKRYDVSVAELVAAGRLTAGETLTSVRRRVTVTATVLPDGTIDLAGVTYPTLSAAAQAASDMKSEPGWEFWAADRDGRPVRLFDIRAEHIAARG